MARVAEQALLLQGLELTDARKLATGVYMFSYTLHWPGSRSRGKPHQIDLLVLLAHDNPCPHGWCTAWKAIRCGNVPERVAATSTYGR